MVGLLFPGQGSQHVGMGADLAGNYPEARDTFAEADDVLGFALSRTAWEGPELELTATHNAQPALLTHSVAVLRVVGAKLGPVACAAGHSLGEFTAYVAAGSLAFADALRLVRHRGELMRHEGERRAGAMAAVIGLGDDQVAALCEEASGEAGICVPANYNSPLQVVISGDEAAVDAAMALARSAGARLVTRLNVSGAFHSPLMEPAVDGLAAHVRDVPFENPRFPVLSNVDGRPVLDAKTAREALVRQLTSAVRWTDCVRAMPTCGAKRFFELGPGHVLGKLHKRIARGAAVQSVGAVADVEALQG